MSQALHLTKDKIERLKTFLSNNDIEKCCNKFKVKAPAFRESICNTVKSLHDFYVNGNEYYLGSFTSTVDLSFNKEMIIIWIKRHDKREKPNAVDNEAIQVNDEEIIRDVTRDFKGCGSDEIESLIRGATWVIKNYKVTGK